MLEIVTPEGRLMSRNVEMIEFPSESGELGILPGHAPLVADLAAGEMRVYERGSLEYLAVAGGYVQVYPSLVRVVATFATAVDDATQIEQACTRARTALETAATESPAVIAGELLSLKTGLMHAAETKLKRKKR